MKERDTGHARVISMHTESIASQSCHQREHRIILSAQAKSCRVYKLMAIDKRFTNRISIFVSREK